MRDDVEPAAGEVVELGGNALHSDAGLDGQAGDFHRGTVEFRRPAHVSECLFQPRMPDGERARAELAGLELAEGETRALEPEVVVFRLKDEIDIQRLDPLGRDGDEGVRDIPLDERAIAGGRILQRQVDLTRDAIQREPLEPACGAAPEQAFPGEFRGRLPDLYPRRRAGAALVVPVRADDGDGLEDAALDAVDVQRDAVPPSLEPERAAQQPAEGVRLGERGSGGDQHDEEEPERAEAAAFTRPSRGG